MNKNLFKYFKKINFLLLTIFIISCSYFDENNTDSYGQLIGVTITESADRTNLAGNGTLYLTAKTTNTGGPTSFKYTWTVTSGSEYVRLGSTNREIISVDNKNTTSDNAFSIIQVSVTDGKNTKSASIEIKVERQMANYDYQKNREVTLSFQYYRRASTTDSFEPYFYSEDPYDDINGSVTFKINSKGIAYSVDKMDFKGYLYCPNSTSSSSIVTMIKCDNSKVKKLKYFKGNTIVFESSIGADNSTPYSFLFSDKADDMISLILGSTNSYNGLRALCYENGLVDSYRYKYAWEIKDKQFFKGAYYPSFEIDENNNLVKGSFLEEINTYFVCVKTIATKFQDINIEWLAELWGIDHFE